MPIQFHLDEHVPQAIADGLRRRGIDVTTTSEVGLIGASDDVQLKFALSQGRVLFTHDDDFLKVQDEHAGIAYCHHDKYGIGVLIDLLELLFHCYTVDQMKNRVEFL